MIDKPIPYHDKWSKDGKTYTHVESLYKKFQ